MDITIIGGGPVGLFAAFYAGLRQAKTKVIESLPILGGQPNVLYPEKDIYDIPAYPKITGSQLTDQLIQQMELFDQEICSEEKVISIEKIDGIFHIQTNKMTHYSKTVIVTIGQGAFKPRKLPFDYPSVFESTNLNYVVKDLKSYKDKSVAILGGGDSAVDWALALESIAKEVFLVHRRDKFRALESSVKQLEEAQVTRITPYVPSGLTSEDGSRISSIELTKARTDETINLDIDSLIVNYGFVSSMDGIENWSVDFNRLGILVDANMQSSTPGLYVAGDAAYYEDKIKLIAVGFGEAPVAVNHAIRYINPKEHLQPVQSTNLNLS